jgi:hypothetical protein
MDQTVERGESWNNRKKVWEQIGITAIRICIYLLICCFVSFPIVKSYMEDRIQCFNRYHFNIKGCDCSSVDPFDSLDCGHVNYAIDYILFDVMLWFRMFIEAGIGIGPLFIFPFVGAIGFIIFIPIWYFASQIGHFILIIAYEQIVKSSLVKQNKLS